VHRPTDNLQAYEAYLKGLFLWSQRTDESVNAGITHFQRAIELDPGFAPAYAGLADCYIVLDNTGTYRPRALYPKANAAALRALELDDTLGEAYASLAIVKWLYDWDRAGAEGAFLKAIELRPGYATAHHWYALYLQSIGAFERSISEITHARELDPLSPIIAANAAGSYFSARRYDEAMTAIREALVMHPRFAIAHWYLAAALLATGAHAEALAAARMADEIASGTSVLASATLGYAHAKLGDRETALGIAAKLTDRYQTSYASPVLIGFLYLGLGDRQTALEWLSRACDDRDGWLRYLKAWPFFDDIRDTPDYQGLLTKIGLAGLS